MGDKTKVVVFNALSLAFNVAVVVLTAYSTIDMMLGGITGNMSDGVRVFRYFTNLSNILVAIGAGAIIPFNIQSLITRKEETPFWATVFKFSGTVSVTVTLLTVILFLGPLQGFEIMFMGPCLYLHLITPLLAIVTFVAFEAYNAIPFGYTFFGLAPTVAYSIVYFIAVVVVKAWQDFYGFTFGGKMWAIPLMLIAMYGATYLFALGLWALRKVIRKARY